MSKINFSGVGVAMTTPFRRDGSIDFNSLRKTTNHLIDNNVDYLVALGTTSEVATMTKDERRAIVDYIIEISENKLPIVMGLGGNNTQQIINEIKETDFTNISAILSVSPSYNKPNQKGIFLHYQAIASACPVPIVLYNVPSRTASNMNAETIVELATKFENIVAIKEASGNFEQVMEIIRDKPTDFQVISGDDALTLPLISIGVEGVISVVANAFPKEFTELVHLALDGKFKEAQQIQYQLLGIIQNLFFEGNPAGVKAAIQILGLAPCHLRLPLTRISKSTYFKLVKQIEILNSQS